MKRSDLRNKYRRKKYKWRRLVIEDWKITRNKEIYVICIFVKKDKRSYLTLNEENVKDSRKLWKTGTQMFSNILVSSEKITLVKNEKIITDGQETAKVLNDFFSNVIKTLNISQANHSDLNFENVRDPTLIVILKYRHHPHYFGNKRKD